MRILITGGAGFVGSSLALAFRRELPNASIRVFDNLKRRGSEVNLARFRARDIRFHHGDIRSRTDLEALAGTFDLIIDASAEPSVHAGSEGSPRYLIETNLGGSVNLLEFLRRRGGRLIFLSTSRVYAIDPLRNLPLEETDSRLELVSEVEGAGPDGISESFPTDGVRSLYGATKLASEQLLQEYVATYGCCALVNRCGVIAGPGQFGKVDQGVFTLWVARHHFEMSLRYTGFGGQGKQVRDLLHPDDLLRLILAQLESDEGWDGRPFNVGGGPGGSVSLLEWTRLCRAATGREVPIGSVPETAPVDIPYYVSDTTRVREAFDWAPALDPEAIARKTADWIAANETKLKSIFGGDAS